VLLSCFCRKNLCIDATATAATAAVDATPQLQDRQPQLAGIHTLYSCRRCHTTTTAAATNAYEFHHQRQNPAAVSLHCPPVQALCWCAAHDGCNGAPLCGHELGQMQQLLILLTCPLCLFDAGVQPLIPAGRTHIHTATPGSGTRLLRHGYSLGLSLSPL
jgi:hypothetical protein